MRAVLFSHGERRRHIDVIEFESDFGFPAEAGDEHGILGKFFGQDLKSYFSACLSGAESGMRPPAQVREMRSKSVG